MTEHLLAAWEEAAGALHLRILEVELELEAPLPVPFPSAFCRGIVGNGLKRGCPSRGNTACSPGTCAWCDLFQPRPVRHAADHWSGALDTIPVPYAVQVTPEEWSRGRVRFLLVGPAGAHGDRAVAALRAAGERGLGRDRVRALVIGVDERLTTAGEEARNVLAAIGDSPHVQLEAISPLRVKCGGRWCRELDPRVLVTSSARRLSALAFHHGPGTVLPAPGREWLAGLAGLPVRTASLRWKHLERWSARQRQRYPAGGLLGEMVMEVPDRAARFFLAAGAVLGIGKGIAYGLGRYRLTAGHS